MDERDKKLADEFFHRGIEKVRLGKYEEAIECYSKSIKLNSKDVAALNNRGIVKSILGKYDEAIKDFEKIIKLDPKDSKAFNNRALARDNLGKKEEAIEDYDKAIELDPQFAESRYNRGAAKMALGRHEEAIKDFDKAIELDSKIIDSISSTRIAKNDLGKPEEIIGKYEEATKTDSLYSDVFNQRGLANSALGKHEEAIKDFDRAVKLDPKNTSALNNRGLEKYNLGKKEEAIEDYDKAIELDPQLAEAFIRRGNIKNELLEKSGDKDIKKGISFKRTEKLVEDFGDIKKLTDFEIIFKELRDKSDEEEENWLIASAGIALLFLLYILGFLTPGMEGKDSACDALRCLIDPLSINSSNIFNIFRPEILFFTLITLFSFRQYTTAKKYRIENTNRSAMAKAYFRILDENGGRDIDLFGKDISQAIFYSTLDNNKEASNLLNMLEKFLNR